MSATPVDEETRITDPVTGGQKGSKLAQLGAIDPLAIIEVARVAGHGAKKYSRYNFLRGYDWSLSFDALQRHLLAFWAGEDKDPDSGHYHLAHAAWHCLALLAFSIRGLGTDDRYQEQATLSQAEEVVQRYNEGNISRQTALRLLGYEYFKDDGRPHA